jgi:hypothetical protein
VVAGEPAVWRAFSEYSPAVARSIALPRPPAAWSAAVARWWPLALLLISALCLVVAEFLVLREIRAVTAVPAGGLTRGGAHHGFALAVVGVASVPMALGAARGGSRPAAVAVTALGAVALLIVLAVDLPSLDDTGIIGRTYDLAKAHPGAWFWLELAGAVGLLCGGVVTLRRTAVARPPRRRRRAD